jgi:hypothetical protein
MREINRLSEFRHGQLVFWPLSVSLVERSVLIAKMTRDVPNIKETPEK